MILTVTPNPALDLTWTAPRIDLGQTHRVPAGAARAGGKGVNVARVLHAQDIPVLAVSTCGGSTGTEFAADLTDGGIPHNLVPVAGATRRSVAVHDAARGTTTVFNELGAPLDEQEWADLSTAASTAVSTAACLVLSGSLPPGAPADLAPELVARARAAGIPSIVDTSGPAMLAAARAGASVVKPNRDELLEATGERDLHRAALVLLAAGATTVLLSLGADGLVLLRSEWPERMLLARLPEALSGNATGAGDAAVAAVAAVLAENGRPATTTASFAVDDDEAMLRRATAWSAAAVLMPLAGEISPEHVAIAGRVLITEEPTAALSEFTRGRR